MTADISMFLQLNQMRMRDRAKDERGNVKRRNSESTGIELHTSQTSRHTHTKRERKGKSSLKNGLINDKNKFGKITRIYT